LKLERWGSPLVQEKYRGWGPVTRNIHNYNNNNNNNKSRKEVKIKEFMYRNTMNVEPEM